MSEPPLSPFAEAEARRREFEAARMAAYARGGYVQHVEELRAAKRQPRYTLGLLMAIVTLVVAWLLVDHLNSPLGYRITVLAGIAAALSLMMLARARLVVGILTTIVFGAVSLAGGTIAAALPTAGDVPAPTVALSAEEEATAASRAATPGPYSFEYTGEGGVPIGWSRCEPLRYTINPDSAPAGDVALLQRAIEEITTAAGLTTEFVGYTDRAPSDPADGIPGNQPVLFAWSTEASAGSLSDDTLGYTLVGEPEIVGGRSHLAAGEVVFDVDDLAALRNPARATYITMLHEVGHLVGLDHVDDPTQLMNPTLDDTSLPALAGGDLAGLAQLSALPC